jgi:dGTPase
VAEIVPTSPAHAREALLLAPYACHSAASRGRRHAQMDDPARGAFQRDRDRIVHSTAFRRLVYKTQVFLNHEGDLFRTRLTHSLEVAQLGRSVARSLRLNEDLVEAVALAHDLGHTPFGHAGQDALNDCMRPYGGFEHNLQSLRVVDTLEQRYPDYPGLNLSFETREGILKHCSMAHAQQLEAVEPRAWKDRGGGVGARFMQRSQPSLEAQVCNVADEIAYNAHDIDDGVRSGLLSLEQLAEVSLFTRFAQEVRASYPGLTGRRLLYESIRRMLSAQVHDLIEHTHHRVQAHAPDSVTQVRQRARPLVEFGADMAVQSAQLKRFLHHNLYRHPKVMQMTDGARAVVITLFARYLNDAHERPVPVAPDTDTPRAVADYIAGMTDRFALREFERLTGQAASV